MAYHFVDSINQFCDDSNHDKRVPNRQNILCGSKSAWRVITESSDFANNNNPPASPDTNTVPSFRVLQPRSEQPAVYVLVDVAYPTALGGSLQTLRTALRSLVATMNENLYIGFATFAGYDLSPGNYLKELLQPVIIMDNRDTINATIELIVTANPRVYVRDVAAAVRDAAAKLKYLDNTGGSILYLVTWTKPSFNTTVMELDMAEIYLSSKIKLVAVETGLSETGLSLTRFASLVDGIYYYDTTYSTEFFNAINGKVLELLQAPVSIGRTLITRIASGSSFSGAFQLFENYAKDTIVSLASPIKGEVVVTLRSPNGDEHEFSSRDDQINWNITGSSPLVTSYSIEQPQAGEWKFSLDYVCQGTCPTIDPVLLQVTSRIDTQNSPPQVNVWTTSSPFGSTNPNNSPLVVYVEVLTVAGRVAGLTVTAELENKDDGSKYDLLLTDTGRTEADISKDGIYSALFYPSVRGTYEISVSVASETTGSLGGKLLPQDQGVICCGSESTTTTLSNYQISIASAVTVQVVNPYTGPIKPSQITDLLIRNEAVINSELQVSLIFTAPFESRLQNVYPVAGYLIKYASNYDDLLNTFETAKNVTVLDGSNVPVSPGMKQEVFASVPYPGKSVYFAVKSVGSSGSLSDMSSIRWSVPNPAQSTVPSTTVSEASSSATSSLVSSTTASTTYQTTVSSSFTSSSTDTSPSTAPSTTVLSSSVTTAASTTYQTTISSGFTSSSTDTTASSVSGTSTSFSTTTLTEETISTSISTAPGSTSTTSSSTTTSSSITSTNSPSVTSESTPASTTVTTVTVSETSGSSTTASSTVTTPTTTASTPDPITDRPDPPPFYETPEFIGGVAAGATVLVIIIAVAVYCGCKKQRKKNTIASPSTTDNFAGQRQRPMPATREQEEVIVKKTPLTKSKGEQTLKEITVVPATLASKENFTVENKKDIEQETDYAYQNLNFEDDDGLTMTAL